MTTPFFFFDRWAFYLSTSSPQGGFHVKWGDLRAHVLLHRLGILGGGTSLFTYPLAKSNSSVAPLMNHGCNGGGTVHHNARTMMTQPPGMP